MGKCKDMLKIKETLTREEFLATITSDCPEEWGLNNTCWSSNSCVECWKNAIRYIKFVDTESQIIRDYANLIYSDFCEIQKLEGQITIKDIARVLKMV